MNGPRRSGIPPAVAPGAGQRPAQRQGFPRRTAAFGHRFESGVRFARFVPPARSARLHIAGDLMATEVKLPELGENVPGGQVVDIKVCPGADVREGQPLVEVEAEKASVEVPPPLAGRLVKFLVKKGDHVNTGQALCLIEDGQAKPHEAKPPKAETGAEEKPPAKAVDRPSEQTS